MELESEELMRKRIEQEERIRSEVKQELRNEATRAFFAPKFFVPLQKVGMVLCGKKLSPLPVEFCDFE